MWQKIGKVAAHSSCVNALRAGAGGSMAKNSPPARYDLVIRHAQAPRPALRVSIGSRGFHIAADYF